MEATATNAITIGAASIADVEAMAALLGELFSLEEDFCPDPQAQRRGLGLMLDGPDRFVAVARTPRRAVVGMGTVQLVVSTAEGGPAALVEDVIVSAPWRGLGLGRRIVAALQDWTASRGATRLQLLADKGNSPALDFYARTGWAPTQLVCLRKTCSPEPATMGDDS